MATVAMLSTSQKHRQSTGVCARSKALNIGRKLFPHICLIFEFVPLDHLMRTNKKDQAHLHERNFRKHKFSLLCASSGPILREAEARGTSSSGAGHKHRQPGRTKGVSIVEEPQVLLVLYHPLFQALRFLFFGKANRCLCSNSADLKGASLKICLPSIPSS